MDNLKNEVILAGLFHDIGKVIRRGTDVGEHSFVGAEFLKEMGFCKNIVDACRYHHGKKLKNAPIENDNIAYIIYLADNISSSADRRFIEGDTEKIFKFNEHICLKSVFNKLNNNEGSLGYNNFNYNNANSLIMPTTYSNLDKGKYIELTNILRNNLKSNISNSINSYLELIEGTMSFVPSCTAENDANDISLFDHSKITAGLAGAIYSYLKEKNISNYKECLLKNERMFLNEKAFLLASFDISGIQKFIYNIKSENALKQLRARSIYLDLIGESLLDEILTECGLDKTSVIYNGGGHAYIILPNTSIAKVAFDKVIKSQNDWFIEHFREKLYVAGGYTECSANELCNKNENGEITNEHIYGDILQRLSIELSKNKLKRFNAEQINLLNDKAIESTEECSVCGLNIVNNQCICSKMIRFGKDIIANKIFVFTGGQIDYGLNLGFFSLRNKTIYLNLFNENEFEEFSKKAYKDIVKVYAKNDYRMGEKYYGKLFIGDYFAKTQEGFPKTFDDFEQESIGIKRIAVLRADIDNLGIAFKKGFENKYATLSRFSTLSRMLSRFFKFHINEILESKKYKYLGVFDKTLDTKNVSIVYSGGDDLCIVGAWNDVIETALLLEKTFKEYCGNTLSISAGIGLYKSGYPMSRMANEVGHLEDVSKDQRIKNSITLFSDDNSGTFYWNDFEQKVLVEKFCLINTYFNRKIEKLGGGKSFIYHLIELLREGQKKRPQIAYLLARLLDDNKNKEDSEFMNKIFEWSKDKNSTKELIMALTLYIYSIREDITNE